MTELDKGRTVETSTEARAGVTGHHVRAVLITSLIGAILVLMLAAAFSFL